MINFMVANWIEGFKHTKSSFEIAIAAQIENSLDVGWEPKDIFVLSNFDFEYLKVKTKKIDSLNSFCLTGSKMFGVQWLLDQKKFNDIVWAHDLDAWQNVWFDPPEFNDVGICQYSRPKFNGGSIFWKKSGKDICKAVINKITKIESPKEEPIIDKIFRKEKYKDRITILNSSFNVGCSGFKERFAVGIKPLRVCHFHPKNRFAWMTFALDRHNTNTNIITPRLRRLLERFYYGGN